MITTLRSIMNSHGFKGDDYKIEISAHREPDGEELHQSFFGSPYIPGPVMQLDRITTNFILNSNFDTEKSHPLCAKLVAISSDMILTITPKGSQNPYHLEISIIYCIPTMMDLDKGPTRFGNMPGDYYE